MPDRYREGTFFVQVVRDRAYYRLRVLKSTQRRPEVVEPDAVVIKLKLRVPDAAFDPLQPEAVITVPPELIQHVVDVEAEAPGE